MLHTDKAIIVEGRYDKIKLCAVVDALIITTDGFGVFNNREKQNFIKKLAREKGIIVLTDSDAAGFKIRNLIKNIVPESCVTHVFIPDIFGTEKRKTEPSKEGKLGVEGMNTEVLRDALLRSGVFSQKQDEKPRRFISPSDLFEAGLTGGMNSAEKRRKFLVSCALPARLSGKNLLQTLNAFMTYEEFCRLTGIQETNNA